MKRRLFLGNFLMYIAILLLPILALGGMIFFLSVHYIQSSVQNRNAIVLRQSIENMDRILWQMESINLNLSIRSSVARKVSEAFNHPAGGIPGDDYSLVNTVVKMLQAVCASNDYIYSIYLYVPNRYDLFIDSNNGIQRIAYSTDSGWYHSYRSADCEGSWFERREVFRYRFETEPIGLVSFYQPLSSPLLPGGVLVLNAYSDKIEGIFNEAHKATEMDFFLLNPQNEIFFINAEAADYSALTEKIASCEQSSLQDKAEGRTLLIHKYPSQKFPGWTYVSVMDHNIFYQLPRTVTHLTWLLILVCFLAGALLAYRMTRRNIDYLEQILLIIERSEQNLPISGLGIGRSDVYGYILTNIVRTFANQATLKAQITEKNFQIQSLEFMALRTQIRPHFLYNTLETINWMTIGLTGGPNTASRMIQNLSQILRYAFSHTLESVSIEAEMDIVQHYLDIQKARYKRFADCIWSVDHTLLGAKILKFMLQPIVENCFQHGLGSGQRRLSIKIRIYQQKNDLHIHILDNGLGMSRERLRQVRERLVQGDVQDGESIGLANTNRRIQLYYGQRYGLSIHSHPGLGSAVHLALPLLYDKRAASPPPTSPSAFSP